MVAKERESRVCNNRMDDVVAVVVLLTSPRLSSSPLNGMVQISRPDTETRRRRRLPVTLSFPNAERERDALATPLTYIYIMCKAYDEETEEMIELRQNKKVLMKIWLTYAD